MRRALFVLFGVFALALPRTALAQAPSLVALDVTEASPGTRVRISGARLGDPATSRVEIGGLPAPTATWDDDRITAYVPAGASGAASVRVITPEGSAELPLAIAPRSSLDARIAWRVDGDGGAPSQHAPGVLSDGTLVIGDSAGFVYAIASDGTVRWIVDARRTLGVANARADRGPVAVDARDVAYVAIDSGPAEHVLALDRDGEVVWSRAFGTGFLAAGPSVGPDGDVYVLHTALWIVSTDEPGPSAGLCRLRSSDGTIVWSNRGDPVMTQVPFEGAPIVFGSSDGGEIDRAFVFTEHRALSTSPGDPLLDAVRGFALDDGRQTFARITGRPSGSASPSQVWPAVRDDGIVLQSSFVSSSVGQRVVFVDPASGEIVGTSNDTEAGGLGSPIAGRGGRSFVIRDQSWLDAFEPDGRLAWERRIVGGPRPNRLAIDGTREEIWVPSPGRVVAVSAGDGSPLDDVAIPTTSSELSVGCAIGLDDARRRAYVFSCHATSSWELVAIDRTEPGSEIGPDAGAVPDAGITTDAGAPGVDDGAIGADAGVATGMDPSPPPSGCTAGARSAPGVAALALIAAAALLRSCRRGASASAACSRRARHTVRTRSA